MQFLYHDTRPRASSAVFKMEVAVAGYVRLTNVETKHTTLCAQQEFNRNYEPIRW